MLIYVIGSLRNPKIPEIGNLLREEGFQVFDDWYAVGPEADDKWKDYEKARGRSFIEALDGEAAINTFLFDRDHLDIADAVVLVMPAGKSGHMELGWMLGKGKPGFVLLEGGEDRWDVMYQFATRVVDTVEELVRRLKRVQQEMK